ncbi:hypothetical protein CRG98_000577 [Punica granatum]|uniref:Uncharacterized protein n=1 Tax=Punica granatum TaxID=22663 RepID=A0A2I0LEC9_PUNGR|nr:hypothetical protein CRG98_000577 [Punica granatum]
MSNAQLNSIQFATRQTLSEFSMLWVPIALSVGQSARQTMRTGQKTVRLKNQRSREAPSFPASVGLEVSMKLATRISNRARKLPIDTNNITADPDVWDMFIKGKGKQKQHVDLEEGSDESDDPVHVAKPILTESRRRVPKRSQSKSSQMQECIDIFRESFTKNQQETPPSAKKIIGDHLANSMSRNGTSSANDNNPGDNENERRQRQYYVVDAGFSNIPARGNGIIRAISLSIIRQQRKKSYSTSAMRQSVMSSNVASVF